MSTIYDQAPHQAGPASGRPAPNAALLVDFDNVTMGMRSDLSKDLQKLLQSDIIRGKVTVQRAYADWRRYPQYIVPLSENSIDLIFAPAYGSSKKNATDIRMAIDGMELIFTRPEIGTYILLTGDSDFSSLVLKLKEYGKYVIGVGIQESSSDILVQNCDEYYSYTSLTGLQKTSETDQKAMDPWVLVEKSVKRMKDRNDVMRSDRLKQVMIELDPAFDEGNFGFSKFSRFLTEASSKGLVDLKKMDNGQYEIAPTGGSGGGGGRSGGRSRSDRGGRDRGREGRSSSRGRGSDRGREEAPSSSGSTSLEEGYDLMRRALDVLLDGPGDSIRDSDVKRRMLEFDRSFDEAEMGFSKFSLFLQQADEDGVIILRKRDSGNYEVALPPESGEPEAPETEAAETEAETTETEAETAEPEGGAPEPQVGAPATSRKERKESRGSAGRGRRTTDAGGARLGPRRGSTRRRGGKDDGPPPLLEGQAVPAGAVGGSRDDETSTSEPGADREAEPARGSDESSGPSAGRPAVVDPVVLGLPVEDSAAIRYLSNSYKGVGVKTAEALVENFGDDLFEVLQASPEKIEDVIPANRAGAVLDAWKEDLSRRKESLVLGETPGGDDSGGGGSGGRSRSGRRTRRGRR